MVDTGTAITLLMKRWADAHGMTIKENVAEYISGANGIDVPTNLRLPHCMFIMNKRVNDIIISQSV